MSCATHLTQFALMQQMLKTVKCVSVVYQLVGCRHSLVNDRGRDFPLSKKTIWFAGFDCQKFIKRSMQVTQILRYLFITPPLENVIPIHSISWKIKRKQISTVQLQL